MSRDQLSNIWGSASFLSTFWQQSWKYRDWLMESMAPTDLLLSQTTETAESAPKKLLKAGYACLYSIQRRKVKSLLWKAPEGMQSVSSYLKHDESLAVRWACVNRSSGLNEFRELLCFTVSVPALFHLSLSLSIRSHSFFPFWQNSRSCSWRTAPPANQRAGYTVWAGLSEVDSNAG